MLIQAILASDYSSRAELENKVRNACGFTPDPKTAWEIRGTREELARLHLSDRSVFWGVKCVITDTPTEATPQKSRERPQRGEVQSFGINGKLK